MNESNSNGNRRNSNNNNGANGSDWQAIAAGIGIGAVAIGVVGLAAYALTNDNQPNQPQPNLETIVDDDNSPLAQNSMNNCNQCSNFEPPEEENHNASIELPGYNKDCPICLQTFGAINGTVLLICSHLIHQKCVEYHHHCSTNGKRCPFFKLKFNTIGRVVPVTLLGNL